MVAANGPGKRGDVGQRVQSLIKRRGLMTHACSPSYLGG
jgi:hypothetical protein